MCVCVCVQVAVQRLKTKLLHYGVKINVDIAAAAAPAHYLGPALMSCCQCKCASVCVRPCVLSVLHIYVCMSALCAPIEYGTPKGI